MHEASFLVNPSAVAEPSERLELAHQAHRSGQLSLARDLYRAVLAARPNNALALAGLGAALAQLGDPEQAIVLLESAVALSRGPQAAASLANLGNALQVTGRFSQALERFEQALRYLPGNAELLVNRGNALRLLDRSDDAAASYRAALRSSPMHVRANEALGVLEHERGRNENALQCLEAAVRAAPQSASVWYNLGVVQMALERPQMAVDSYARALALRPDDANSHHNYCLALKALDRDKEALAHVERAIALRPAEARFHASRGHLLWKRKQADAALASYRDCLALKPSDSAVWLALADSLRMQRRYREAIDAYERALCLAPDDSVAAKAHFNLATCQLRLADYTAGWENFEWRWGDTEIMPPHRFALERLWVGNEPIAGRRILVHSEQGFGDVIQFSRFLPLLAAQGAHVFFEVAPSLAVLLKCFEGVCHIVPMGEALPEHDRHIPLLSLPLALRIGADRVSCAKPYLWAPQDRVALWQKRLDPRHRPRVGLVWAGNPAYRNDTQRSMSLSQLAPLLRSAAGERIDWVSLQRDPRPEDVPALENLQLRRFEADLKDFADTAALIDQLDLVISVDTAIAHLAGAVGKPVWILLPLESDWRWLLDRSDSPWYPTARLFRQTGAAGWDEVLDAIGRALADHEFDSAPPKASR